MTLKGLDVMSHDIPRTVKLQGSILGAPVVVLVDSGATHNFVSQQLVHKLGWVMEDTPKMDTELQQGV
ncbi:hypothetical protein A2U01_0063052, partial [Trifolium medium]|nr:hypothetical protein [Trifolium medium]